MGDADRVKKQYSLIVGGWRQGLEHADTACSGPLCHALRSGESLGGC